VDPDERKDFERRTQASLASADVTNGPAGDT
jgi:hypothetical protein